MIRATCVRQPIFVRKNDSLLQNKNSRQNVAPWKLSGNLRAPSNNFKTNRACFYNMEVFEVRCWGDSFETVSLTEKLSFQAVEAEKKWDFRNISRRFWR